MKTKKKKNVASELTQEEVFREKVHHYLVCFIDQCPLHEQCLRWMVGQYADTRPLAYNAINPRNPNIGGEQCEMFRKCQRVMMKRGFKDLFHEMPGYMERGIRHSLISIFGHRKYFEMRRGDRLITPEQQQDIAAICQQYGWTGPIVYDGEQEEWSW